MLSLWWVLFALVSALLGVYLKYFTVPRTNLPGPPSKWFVGNASRFLAAVRKQQAYLEADKMHSEFGPTYALTFPGRMFIFTVDPEIVRVALDLKGTAIDQSFLDAFGELTKGLLALKGDIWQHHRSFIVKSFTNDTLRTAVTVTNQLITKMMTQLTEAAEKRVAFDTIPFFVNLTTTVISNVVFGTSPSEIDLTAMFKSIALRCALRGDIPRLFWPVFFRDQKEFYADINKVRGELAKLIENRKKYLAQPGCPREVGPMKLLDAMLEQSKTEAFSDDEILDEVVMFYFAGSDTSSHAMTFAIYELAKHPEIADKILLEVMNECNNASEISWDQANSLPYTEMVIKEVLRLHPVAPATSRSMEEDVKIGDLDLKKGMTVITTFYTIHRSPEYWNDPELFDPDRFTQPPRNGTFLPFGTGRKSCIGNRFAMLEMKVALAQLVRSFKFQLDESRPPKEVCGITLGFDTSIGNHVFVTKRA